MVFEQIIERLRNLSPRSVAIIMSLVILLAPFALTNPISGGTGGYEIGPITIGAILWRIQFGSSSVELHLQSLWGLLPSLFLSAPTMLFGGLVVLYCQGKAKWSITAAMGLFGFAFFFIASFPLMMRSFELGHFAYTGPLPVQLIIGLILMKMPGAPQLDCPWKTEDQKDRWWKQD